MKAARWHAARDIRVEDIPEPVVKDGQVKVKVKWCGICGSDLHEYCIGPISIPVAAPHPLSGETAPVVMGHEFSGEVVEVGAGVTNVKPGDRVVVEPILACGECPSCKEGKYNTCEKLGFHGLAGGGGGFSEYTTFASRFVHKIPDSLSYEKAALVEPIAVGYHSLMVGNFRGGDVAVVAGAGPIGLATIECLRALGASKIICVQLRSIRHQYALEAGADVVFDPNETDVLAEVYKLTGGRGADIAFDTTGAEPCYHLLFDCVRRHGTLVITSIWEKSVTINLNKSVMTEKNVVGSLCYCDEFPKVIDLIAKGRIKADNYATSKIYIDDVVSKGFDVLIGPDKLKEVKILVTPDKSLL